MVARGLRLLVSWCVMAGVGAGCSRDGGDAAPVDRVDAAPAPRAEGFVIFGGESLSVAPFVAHDPHLDLRVNCLQMHDRLVDAGATDVPELCFDPEPRTELTSIFVEHVAGRRGSDAVKLLRAGDGSAHFIVEPTGGIYQILDLQYAPRRDGRIRPGEIRILSGDEAGHQRLVRALVARFPKLKVEASSDKGDAPQPPTATQDGAR